jgi:hypothetical protein
VCVHAARTELAAQRDRHTEQTLRQTPHHLLTYVQAMCQLVQKDCCPNVRRRRHAISQRAPSGRQRFKSFYFGYTGSASLTCDPASKGPHPPASQSELPIVHPSTGGVGRCQLSHTKGYAQLQDATHDTARGHAIVQCLEARQLQLEQQAGSACAVSTRELPNTTPQEWSSHQCRECPRQAEHGWAMRDVCGSAVQH